MTHLYKATGIQVSVVAESRKAAKPDGQWPLQRSLGQVWNSMRWVVTDVQRAIDRCHSRFAPLGGTPPPLASAGTNAIIPIMNIQGHYINLDSSTDRRELVESNLAQEGMSEYFTRFSALRGDGRPANITQGELGCYLSHETIINNSRTGSHTLILEDDAVLPPGFKDRFFSILQSALRQPWDILFLCQSVGVDDLHLLAQLMAVAHQLQIQRTKTRQPQYAFLDAKAHYRWGCVSYLIRAGAQQKISQCLKLDSANGHHQPIDLAYQQAVRDGRIIAKCVMPYQIGTRNLGTTTFDRGGILDHQLRSTLINLFVEGLDKSELFKKAQSGFSDAPLNVPAFVVSQMHYKKLIDMSRRAAAALER